jgi:hypothetical protein
MSIGLAFRTFWKVLGDRAFADRIRGLALPVPVPDPKEEQRQRLAEQLRLLAILQRDGRLLDFLSEDLADYSDAQIGAAVRDIHRDCKLALSKYVTLEPVAVEKEEASVEIPVGFDPSRWRLVGQVRGQPPYRGTVAHRGWRAAKVELPPRGDTSDPTILAPAEVEIS